MGYRISITIVIVIININNSGFIEQLIYDGHLIAR